MKKSLFDLFDSDIVYIITCIQLTKDILTNGRPELFSKYFKKEKYNTYMYELTLLQMYLGREANEKLYGCENKDLFLGYLYYLKNLDFKDLSKVRKEYLKDFKKSQFIKINSLQTEIKKIKKKIRNEKFKIIKKSKLFNILKNCYLMINRGKQGI